MTLSKTEIRFPAAPAETYPQTAEEIAAQIQHLQKGVAIMRAMIGGWFAANVSPGMVQEQQRAIWACEDLDSALCDALGTAQAQMAREQEDRERRAWQEERKHWEYAR